MPVIVARQTFECSPDVLTGMFEERPDQWLTTFVRLACLDGEAEGLRTDPSLAGEGIEPRPTCVVTVGSSRFEGSGAVVFPVRWIAIGYRSIARAFSGHIEIMPAERSCLVTITGSCRGERGRSFDSKRASRAAAHAVLRSLLSNLAAAVAAANTPALQGTVTEASPRA